MYYYYHYYLSVAHSQSRTRAHSSKFIKNFKYVILSNSISELVRANKHQMHEWLFAHLTCLFQQLMDQRGVKHHIKWKEQRACSSSLFPIFTLLLRVLWDKVNSIQTTHGCVCPPRLPLPHSLGRCLPPGWSSQGNPSGLPLTAVSHAASGNRPEPWPSRALWKTLWTGENIQTVKASPDYTEQKALVPDKNGKKNVNILSHTAQSTPAYPLNTPKTRLRTKKDPKMTRLTK